MPWTFAHPAAVLSLRTVSRGHFHFAALIVGSLSPDFGYYIGQFRLATLAHTSSGLFFVCLPSGVIVLFLARTLRQPVCFLLPQPHRSAIATLPDIELFKSGSSILLMAASILLGALTHVVWDSFTHASGWMVSQSHLLQRDLIFFGRGAVPAYHVLQHASTFFGTAALLIAYVAWLRRMRKITPPGLSETDRWRYILLGSLAVVALIFAVPLALAHSASFDGYFAVRAFMFRAAITSTMTFAALLVASGLYLAWRSKDP